MLPYALAPTTFRFSALASLAGRAPLGGPREVALAVYLMARLGHDVLPEQGLAQQTRADRATHARSWLSTVALPAAVRPALAALVDASAGSRSSAGTALRDVVTATQAFLDRPSLAELDGLVKRLELP
jgi:hypothetical protein